jgi:hypothetical protein
LTAIASNQLNVDSITFISQTTGLSITSAADTVIFIPQQAGELHFKGLGWRNNQIVEISPRYVFSAILINVYEEPKSEPENFNLLQNYPNPFNPSTVISWLIPSPAQGSDGQAIGSHVKLSIFDLTGREVAVLVKEKQEAGYHQVTFDASGLASGIYIYRLSLGPVNSKSTNLVLSKKMFLLK